MAETMKNQASQWWWLDTHSIPKRSQWLQSTLNELNKKTQAMLKLIEQDADSFAQRAEMYYKKRPELLSLVEDFYRTHRLLAERYDQVRPDAGTRPLKAGGSPFASSPSCKLQKAVSFADSGYDSNSESCDVEDEFVESEVDDPEHEDDKDLLKKKDTIYDEVAMMLREELEELRIENKTQKDHLKQKDEEKMGVIRHLSLAVDLLKQDNVKMRSFISKELTKTWKKNPFEWKLFSGASKKHTNSTLDVVQKTMEVGAKAGIDSEGGKAMTDPPGLAMESGFGGLGLEGIVGNEDSEGVKAALPGVGNKGSISGESVGDTIGEEEDSTLGNTVGAAEIVETCMVL
ncbi:hypothetical protein PIB30_043669 [Stylosanthes scabra]|uniref:NAB domain-containing protein n=1 Tax=Stylosanthes scabra TaxID=79078 RepID=A0ABU6ZEC0_9FABA|nr:hypothetical protein [Stylosanthes scabra]